MRNDIRFNTISESDPVSSPINVDEQFARLDNCIEKTWASILSSSPLVKAIENGTVTKELYVSYMLETYHYTAHNAKNQALVGTRAGESPTYMKFCFEHAAEETGHERMALHDICSIGFPKDPNAIPSPLPETEILIAYLYWISLTGNPVQRLGYSYWAENAYHYIMPLVKQTRDILKLQDSQLTFFIGHAEIDKNHLEDVRHFITSTCKSEADWQAVTRVAVTSLELTGRVMNAAFFEYERFVSRQSRRLNVGQSA
jgi:thiaminase